ncbi:glutamine--fructose-6-phosphate transaminase (isomerizing) [bacterium]|nr:glutamine--fructose-6-phosphate transaminase (isomerizing) [candidate division CSSED10-310 bacterium]
MCGIAGIAGSENVVPRLYKALLNLEYRGYDSCGIAALKNGEIEIRKDSGPVNEVGRRHRFHEMSGNPGIGHTRWATTGKPSLLNAHPHSSCSGDFALIHNGIISNYRELREKLIRKGHQFKSETDTEVLVHLIEDAYSSHRDLELALRLSAREISGTYAFAFITTHDPHSIYCARNESPLIIGVGSEENYIGSDYNAILEYTRRVITMLDGEYAVVNSHTVAVKNLETGMIVEHEISRLDWDPELSKKGGFPHYMLKEIHEQPATAESVLGIDPKIITGLAEAMQQASRIYLIGVGTTYYVALISQYYFARLTGRYISTISSDEFPYLGEIDDRSLVIAFSQSGETYDTLHALRYAKHRNAKTAAVINVMGSTMLREVDMPILQHSGPEICVLSTKAAMAQILIALRTALHLGHALGFLTDETFTRNCAVMEAFPSQIRRYLNESKGFINTIAARYKHIKNWLYIGRGIYYGIAMESALKMKEVTYHHAEGIPGGFMKHGTISLIEDGIGSIFFLPPDMQSELYHHTIANAEEIKARKGLLIGFGLSERNALFDDQIMLPDMPEFCVPLMLLVTGQLFAYYSAVALNRNVDKPRSLAKSVTVA